MATEQARLSRWQDELVPNIVDHLSRVSPQAVFAEYPISPTTYDDGFRQVTYQQFANAINGAAHWLTDTLGPGENFEVLTYIGPNDIRYNALILGAIKAGYVIFTSSPRNSVQAQAEMFKELKCTKLLSPDPKPPPVAAFLEKHPIAHFAVPTVEQLLDEDHRHFPYNKTYPDAQWDPIAIIHTSGSTGTPKPLTYTHETAMRNMNMLAQGPKPGYRSFDRLIQGKRVINCFPPFHGAYLVSHMFNGVPFGSVMIGPLSGAIPTAKGIVDALHKTKADIAFLVPSIAVEFSQDPELLQYLADHVKLCIYAGGDLPQPIGDAIAAKVELHCYYGASEVGLVPQLLPEDMDLRKDWKYVYFHPCLGMQFDYVADGLSELVQRRGPEHEKYQHSLTLFREADEYRTRDLFQPHPTIPDFWTWRARADDIIVFLNGEKTNPVAFEQHLIAKNPDVSAAIVTGTQRFQAALLLEAVLPDGKPMTTSEEAAFIEKVWPSIEEANKAAPAHARIEKAMVLPMSPHKPVQKAGKGTIQRAATIMQYTKELDELYKNADLGLEDGESAESPLEAANSQSTRELIRSVIVTSTELAPDGDGDNLFDLGMDSLAALSIVRRLRRRLALTSLSLATLYTNPSVQQLSHAIDAIRADQEARKATAKQTSAETSKISRKPVPGLKEPEKPVEIDGHDKPPTLAKPQTSTSPKTNGKAPQKPSAKERPEERPALRAFLEEYRQHIQQISRPKQKPSAPFRHRVVLTGSTGYLGTYLLGSLLDDPSVEHVYCLNRKDAARMIQKNRFNSVGLNWPRDETRLSFLKADLADSHLGLGAEGYKSLQNSVSAIIHNAWPVRFDLPLDTFRAQMLGIVNLATLAATASHLTSIFFVSSISSAMSYQSWSGLTPEQVIPTTDAPFTNGYAESKWVAENLCDEAARHLDLPIAFARVGQIAGPARAPGLWNPAEWLPRLMMSSIYFGALPDTVGKTFDKVDWIPIDLLADIIVELAMHPQQPETNHYATTNVDEHSATVFHLRNPHSGSWRAVLPDIESSIRSATGKKVDVVSADQWLDKLQEGFDKLDLNSSSAADLKKAFAQNPALQLFDFYTGLFAEDESLNELDLSKTLACSKNLQALEGVGSAWLRKWIGEWLATSPPGGAAPPTVNGR